MSVLLRVDIADSRLDAQTEPASAIGKLDAIARQQQMIGVPFVMEAQAGEYGASRQIVFDVHQRMAVTADRALLLTRLKPRRADPPEDQRSAAHRPDESENLSSLTREPVPQLRPRQKLEHFCVVVSPKPTVTLYRQCGLSNSKEAFPASEIGRPVHVTHEKFRRREGIYRYQCRIAAQAKSEIRCVLRRIGIDNPNLVAEIAPASA